MTRNPGAHGRVHTAVRVFPPGEADAVRAFVAETVGEAHPCHADAVLLSGTLAGTARTGAAVIVAYAPEWAYVTVRPVGRTRTPSPPAGFGPAGAAAEVITQLESHATRWGLTRESSKSALWFELDATRPHPAGGRTRCRRPKAS